MPNKTKVYCNECEFIEKMPNYIQGSSLLGIPSRVYYINGYRCLAKIVDTPFRQSYANCEDVNKNNSCKLYKKFEKKVIEYKQIEKCKHNIFVKIFKYIGLLKND